MMNSIIRIPVRLGPLPDPSKPGRCYDSEDLEVVYQCMREPGATARQIAPHALASDGSRWHMRDCIDVVIYPRAELSERQRSAIVVGFDMKQGRLVLNCRKALAFYVLRQLQLGRQPDASIA